MFWGLIASMYIGNVVLLILNLPLVGLFVNLLRIPYAYLAPGVLLVSMIGIYSVNSNAGEIVIMGVFGVIGYVLRKAKFDPAPLLLAIVLGDRMEVSLRRALTISQRRLVGSRAGRHVEDLHRRRRAAGRAAGRGMVLRLPPQDGGGRRKDRRDQSERKTHAHDTTAA